MKVFIRPRINLTLSRQSFFCVATASAVVAAYIVTITTGWTYVAIMMWLAILLLTISRDGRVAYYLRIVAVMVFILAATPVQTSTELLPGTIMLIGMCVAMLLPFVVQRAIRADDEAALRLKAPMRSFTRREWQYIMTGLAVVVPWLVIYFITSSVEQYWSIQTATDAWLTFGAIMMIGAWEEVFFIAAIMGMLRQCMPFWWANVIQGVLFTAFLWQVGFREWGTVFLITYCLYQGYVYAKTKNLWVTLLIHAVVDVAVFLLLLVKTWLV